MQEILTPEKGKREAGTRFRAWVQEELQRQPPNIQPLVKLAWVEWFFFPLPVADQSTGWIYDPPNYYGLTIPKTIRAELERAGLTGNHPIKRFYGLLEVFHDYLLSASRAGRFTPKKN